MQKGYAVYIVGGLQDYTQAGALYQSMRRGISNLLCRTCRFRDEERKVDLSELLTTYHDRIVDTWTYHMRHDQSTRYADEPEEELRVLVDRGATAFRSALVHDQWNDLDRLISLIARKRLQGGFSLSEVQRGFEHYRKTVTMLIVANFDPRSLGQVLLNLQNIVVYAITGFSTFYQGLHERFLANQAR